MNLVHWILLTTGLFITFSIPQKREMEDFAYLSFLVNMLMHFFCCFFMPKFLGEMQTWQKPALFVSQVPCAQSLLGSLLVSPWQMKFVSVTDRILAASCSSFTYHHLHLFCVLCTATYKLNTSFFKMFNEHQWTRIPLVWPTAPWVYIMEEVSIPVKNKF